MWQHGAFELAVSPLLLAELRRVLAYPKIRKIVSVHDAETMLALIVDDGVLLPDPAGHPAIASRDQADNYLILLAEAVHSPLVSGDEDLLSLAGQVRVLSPAQFLRVLEGRKPD